MKASIFAIFTLLPLVAHGQLVVSPPGNNDCEQCPVTQPGDWGNIIRRTSISAISKTGCPECRINGEGIVDFVDGFYREVVQSSGVEPENSLFVSIRRSTNTVDTRADGLDLIDTQSLVPGVYPFARPAIIGSFRQWGANQ